MLRRILTTGLICLAILAATQFGGSTAQAAGRGQPTDWNRFNYYPYLYYPHNFRAARKGATTVCTTGTTLSSRIPVQNKNWYNFYGTEQPYHRGHHFILDVF